MKESDKQALEWIITYCNRIEEHVSIFGDDEELYKTNKQFQDACSLVIIQIGEQVGRLSDEFKKEHNNIPWRDIKDMRNIHAHDYQRVMFDIAWETIKYDLPQLKSYIEGLI